MDCRRGLGALVAVVALAGACSSTSTGESSGESSGTTIDDAVADATDGEQAPSGEASLRLPNQGGSLEGHTPRGFAGSGTGLFVGDNLNPGFPDGDGVQLFLTFTVPDGTPPPDRAILGSEVMSTSGTPFEDLGTLRVEPVSYEAFGPPLFDLEADGAATTCEVIDASQLRCDVTDGVASALDQGRSLVQFRLRFERAGDNDGQPDLALFFISDSNTNEAGIFTLELS